MDKKFELVMIGVLASALGFAVMMLVLKGCDRRAFHQCMKTAQDVSACSKLLP